MTQPSGSSNPWDHLTLGEQASLAIWKSLSPETKQAFQDALIQWAAQQHREAQTRELVRVKQELVAVPVNALPPPPKAAPFILELKPLRMQDVLDALSPAPANPAPAVLAVVAEPDARLRQVIIHPSVVLVLGKRGSGKSGLGYRLLELFRYVAQPYVVGLPQAARSLLPKWIGIAPSLEEAPPKSIVLIDEAYLAYHARGSMARGSKAMSQRLNLSRQRQQTLIFVSQEARQVDRNIASSANVVIFKDLGILQLEFDRPELNKLAGQAKEAFSRVAADKRGWAYVYAPDHDFQGLLENGLPSFWKPGLSRLFATEAPPTAPRAAKVITPQEKASRAKELRPAGASYSEIAQSLGVTRGTVVNYLKDYPYRS